MMIGSAAVKFVTAVNASTSASRAADAVVVVSPPPDTTRYAVIDVRLLMTEASVGTEDIVMLL
jgi:hypothetical protein